MSRADWATRSKGYHSASKGTLHAMTCSNYNGIDHHADVSQIFGLFYYRCIESVGGDDDVYGMGISKWHQSDLHRALWQQFDSFSFHDVFSALVCFPDFAAHV